MLDNLKGRVVEYDPPGNLLADRKSILFFSMAKNAGLAAY